MEIVLNSKFFAPLSIEQLGEKAIGLGYDGIDICIRPGHPIQIDNAAKLLPQAMRVWEKQGLVCPLATAAVDINQPTQEVRNLYAACAEVGIPRLKIGFWRYKTDDDYWRVVEAARNDLAGFVRFSQQYEVQTCYQIHSGSCIGSNCAGLMHLIKDFDPQYIGAYPDLGHLALDGEDWDMGFSMIKDYISVVGIKDALYLRQPEGQTPSYIPCFVKVGEGCINWHHSLRKLLKHNFDGPLTVHTEYKFDESIIRQVGYADTSPPNLEQWAKEDVTYLRQILSEMVN
ncbi:MAG: sugar phosphate isomerase/epimerase [Candidatus Poribacteria bacterium]|nr:sugar phosphate isomerase/epimerase [Candidatus Poribacteria bacterium]